MSYEQLASSKNDRLGCARLRCPEAENFAGALQEKGYWCCQGCTQTSCRKRCQNSRDRCGLATSTSRQTNRPHKQPQWDLSGQSVYMAVTADVLELPLAVEDTVQDLATHLGLAISTVYRALNKQHDGGYCGMQFIKINIPSEED